VRKATVLSQYDLTLLYKDNFEKNHNKKKPSGEILQQSTVFFLKIKKLNFQPVKY